MIRSVTNKTSCFSVSRWPGTLARTMVQSGSTGWPCVVKVEATWRSGMEARLASLSAGVE